MVNQANIKLRSTLACDQCISAFLNTYGAQLVAALKTAYQLAQQMSAKAAVQGGLGQAHLGSRGKAGGTTDGMIRGLQAHMTKTINTNWKKADQTD